MCFILKLRTLVKFLSDSLFHHTQVHIIKNYQLMDGWGKETQEFPNNYGNYCTGYY